MGVTALGRKRTYDREGSRGFAASERAALALEFALEQKNALARRLRIE
jgi:hypothetical protein